jgi:hypothetical protein
VIGPAGGRVSSADGGLEVIVPPGAVNSPTAFSIATPNALSPALPPGRKAVTPVWDVTAMGPSGPVSVFNRPLGLIAHYRDAAPTVLASWDGQEWVHMETTIDRGARTASASMPHLTPVVGFATATTSVPPAARGGSFPIIPASVVVVAILLVGAVTYIARTRLGPPPA